jgi:hypothetical protein
MLDTIYGLPVHPLVVHATVVIVPMAAVAVMLAAAWPRFRAWAGWGPLMLAVGSVILTPLSTSSGQSFEHQLGGSRLIDEHSHLADLLIWWVAPLAVVAAALYWLHSYHGGHSELARGRVLSIALLVVPVVVAVGTLVQVVLIGHSGARAAWANVGAPLSAQSGPASTGT